MSTDAKMQPTTVDVETFLAQLTGERQSEARLLIQAMQQIAGEPAVMWGSSIIGFSTQHYTYDSGREGDMPKLGFSPRKTALTIYFNEGFDRYEKLLTRLGKHTLSVSCLYVKKLADIDLDILRQILEQSYALAGRPAEKPTTVEEYISHIPVAARPHFEQLRSIATELLPDAREVFSYGIVGYKIDSKRARVFISGWKDHVAIYPVPNDATLQEKLKPYIKGKGTLWFPHEMPLPEKLIAEVIAALCM